MTMWTDEIKRAYDLIKPHKEDFFDLKSHPSLTALDTLKPPIDLPKSKVKVFVNPTTNTLEHDDTYWTPNFGIDPNTSYYSQNRQNGVYNNCKKLQNHEFNDILLFKETNWSSRYSGGLNFNSLNWSGSIVYISLNDCQKVFEEMREGFFIGRFKFSGHNYNRITPL